MEGQSVPSDLFLKRIPPPEPGGHTPSTGGARDGCRDLADVSGPLHNRQAFLEFICEL